jgi:maltose operon protein
MKMKKSLVALCLSAGCQRSGCHLCRCEFRSAEYQCCAGHSGGGAAATDLDAGRSIESPVNAALCGRPTLNVPGITGPVAAFSVPANIGELTLTLTSEVNKQTSVFAPNVLILDQNMTPSAFFPSEYFSYQEPGVMSADRLEGVMRLTPALGQQKIYVLVFTTEKDLQQTTKLIDPAKAYAKGTGNSVPDIRIRLARHVTDGLLKLKVSTNNASSVLVGPLFGSSGTGPVTVGNTAAPVYALLHGSRTGCRCTSTGEKAEPVLNDTEE